MENGALPNRERAQKLHASSGTVALNNKYAAILSDSEVQITRLDQLDEQIQHLPCPKNAGWGPSIVALSHSPPDLCAVSTGSITYIFDLNTPSLKHVLTGIGRTVTSISFSTIKTQFVVTGHIDGSVCLWDFLTPNKPIQRIIGVGGACDAISLSEVDSNLLATVHNSVLHIWSLDHDATQPVCSLKKTPIDAFAWHPSTEGLFSLSDAHAEIKLCKLLDSLRDTNPVDELDSDGQESDTEIFGEPDGIRNDLRQLSSLDVRFRFRSLSWIDEGHLLGLSQNGKHAILYSVDETYRFIETWTSKLENASCALNILDIQGELNLLAIGNESFESQILPASVAIRLRRDTDRDKSPNVAASNENGTDDRSRPAPVVRPSSGTRTEKLSPTMAPRSIAKQRSEDSAFKRTSSQLQRRRRLTQSRNIVKTLVLNEHIDADSQETLLPLQDHDFALPPSLEEDDLETPMPFLSPTIPARRISPNDMSPLYESGMQPHQLPSLSFDSSLPSTMFDGQDSDDSDDETFVDDLQGSAAFLPGGINVPLPKACGALFAPNGQLLTFFPPKPRPVSARRELPVDEPQQDRREGQKTARLFPTFANLQSDFDLLNEDSNSDDPDSLEGDASDNGLLPRFNFQPASFPSQLSWKSQDLTINRIISTQESQHKVVVNVHNVMDVCALLPTQRTIAKDYRLLCHAGESGSELCIHNAVGAENSGAAEVAEVWRLLAIFLEDQVPLDVLSGESLEQDVFTIAERVKSTLNWNGLNTHFNTKHSGKVRWSDHPCGGIWLVRRILEWAERRADVQSLACMSSVLSEAERRVAMKQAPPQQSLLTHLPMHSLPYLTDTIKDLPSQSMKFGIPLLRRHAATITSLNESPTKFFQPPSLSGTPYLDSSTTPPLSLPSISRQSTRLSSSGSASPELPRGSFSAAARYYGQAITERLTSYGTSPPSRRIDANPSTNTELSSSFPTTGSWPGKSVSFASTPSEDTSRRSYSVSAYRANQDDEEYDSDKTIEDSLPHTPRGSGNAPVVNIGNPNAFADEISGRSRARLIPDDLAQMVIIWNQYYSELLRSWDMLLQATELEKVTGLASGIPPQTGNAGLGDGGMAPAALSQRRKAVCDICFTATKGIMQICTSCLHSSHLKCLEEYIVDLGIEEEFTCPSGCGCRCSELPYVAQNPSAAPASRPLFRKKTSFTDPRRWRKRVEGDTW